MDKIQIMRKKCGSLVQNILQNFNSQPRHAKIAARYLSMQQNLPRLPVPPLQHTLDKYLTSVRPVVDDDEFAVTKQVVEEFGKTGGLGEKLQIELEKRADKLENWLSQWWLDGAYLTFRMPVIVHSSPALIFPAQDFSGVQGQIRYAAKFLSGILDFKQLVDGGSVPVQYAGKEPLDMSQFYLVLNSCRVPGVKKDSLITHPPTKPNPPKHVIVIHRNHIFSVDVYDNEGQPLSTFQIGEHLKDVVAQSQNAAPPIGLLTTENRNSWGKTYLKLAKDRANKNNLERIQSSILVVCLDEPVSSKYVSRDLATVNQMLHGGGHELNSGNRWFDKTVQLIVGRDGGVGCLYEHSPAEGPPVVAIMDHALDYIASGVSADDVASRANINPPTRLDFKVSDDVLEDIETAKRHLASLIRDCDISRQNFDGFGKRFVKQQKCSPDAFFQMALHLTFFRIHGEPASCYETASVRKFLYGRTETIRSCTSEAVQFCRAMLDESTSNNVRSDLLRAAIKRHSDNTRDCQEGRGIDRHLFGLKNVAIETGLNVPDLFMDPAFGASTHFRLSTSQVPTKHEMCMFYGPSCPDGYGICYNPQDDKFIYVVTAFNSSPVTNAEQFAQTMNRTLVDMQTLLLRSKL